MKLKLKRFLITSAILVSSIARHHLITATDALPLSSGSLADSSPTRAVHVHSHKNTNTNKPLNTNTNTNTNTDISTMNKITATATGRNAIRNTRHYIFGYGSLICPQSRKITCPTLTKPAIPVIVQHIQRTWTARLEHKAVTAAAAGEEEKSDLDPLRGQTAMGIQLAEGHECTGVLIEVDDQELANFDQRERGYDRVQIDLNHIFPHEDGSIDINVNVDGSIDHHDRHRHHHHHVIRQSHRTRKNLMARNSNMDDADDSSERQHHNEQEEEDEEDEAKVWVYLPKGGGSGANHQYPILQSYVDIILRGCLTISKEFAKSFLESTHGWDHDPDLHGEFLWLDDRHLPYYSRADTGWSEEMKHFIDELVRDVHPEPLEKRMHLDTLRERLRCTE